MASVNLREKPLRDGIVSLVLDYHDQGVRHKKTLKIYVNLQDVKSRNPAQREAYHEAYRIAHIEKNKVEKRLLHQEHDIAPTFDRQACFLTYFDELATRHCRTWRSVSKYLHRFSPGKLPMGNLTYSWVCRFQDYLLTHMQVSTARGYVGILQTSLSQAVREQRLPTNPGVGLRKVRVPEKPPKCLDRQQVEVLLQHRQGIPEWLVQAFLFSCYTGLRISDVRTLVWGEVQGNGFSEGRPLFKVVKAQIKTEDTVQIPLTSQAIAILEELGLRHKTTTDARERVFNMRCRSTTTYHVRRWRKQAGVFFTYHSSRHTFGTNLQTAGVDIYTTSRLMGHRSITTTTRYAKVVDRQRDQAIEKLGDYLA